MFKYIVFITRSQFRLDSYFGISLQRANEVNDE